MSANEQRRCAKCHKQYDAKFDACPYCTKKQEKQDALEAVSKGLGNCGCLMTVFVTVPILLFLIFGLRACG